MADVDIEKKLTTNHAYGISALVLVMCWCINPFEIGKYTLVLYLVPVLILPAKTFVLNGQVTFASESLIILSIAVLHSLVSYVIGRIIYEIPYLRLILFGKK